MSYNKFFEILSDYTSKEFAKKQIENNKNIIISKSSEVDYRNLLANFSLSKYDVEEGDMVEFLGTERKKIESSPRPDEKKIIKILLS